MSSLICVSILKKIGAGSLGQNFQYALAGALGPLVPYRWRHFVWKIKRFQMICDKMGLRDILYPKGPLCLLLWPSRAPRVPLNSIPV